MIMIIINICLLIVALILAIITHEQEKLLNEYDKCLKDKSKIQRLELLANLAKFKGYDVKIEYSTIYDHYYVALYKKEGVNFYDTRFAKTINNDEELKKIINEIERLIK